MPIQFKMIREMYKEDEMQNKPEIDVYEIEELENKIHYAEEGADYILTISFKGKRKNVKVWRKGFFHDLQGRICRLDEIRKEIYLKNNEDLIGKINFKDIKEINILD